MIRIMDSSNPSRCLKHLTYLFSEVITWGQLGHSKTFTGAGDAGSLTSSMGSCLISISGTSVLMEPIMEPRPMSKPLAPGSRYEKSSGSFLIEISLKYILPVAMLKLIQILIIFLFVLPCCNGTIKCICLLYL